MSKNIKTTIKGLNVYVSAQAKTFQKFKPVNVVMFGNPITSLSRLITANVLTLLFLEEMYTKYFIVQIILQSYLCL